jgi:hypothetical protein
MIIDIEPHMTIEPNVLQAAHMETYGHKELFCFYRNGKAISVDWTREKFREFVPSHTVGSFIESNTLNAISNFAQYMAAWKRGEHPTWTSIVEEQHPKWHHIKHKVERPTKLSSDNRAKETAAYMLKEAYYNAVHPLVFVRVVK